MKPIPGNRPTEGRRSCSQPSSWRILQLWLLLLLPGIPCRVHAQTGTESAFTFTTLAGNTLSDQSDGPGPQAGFIRPEGIAIDSAGYAYVIDRRNLTIRRISPSGVVSTIAGLPGTRGTADGIGRAARFTSPRAIAVDRQGNVLVGDNYTIRRITPSGTNWLVTTIAGQFGVPSTRDGRNVGTRFTGPDGMVVDNSGTIYVADGESFQSRGVVRRIRQDGTDWVVDTIANALGYVLIPVIAGPSLTNRISVITRGANAIAIDPEGNLYLTDVRGASVSMLKKSGNFWTEVFIAGRHGTVGSLDGTGSDALFLGPGSLTRDGLGNLYVTDGGSLVRRISPGESGWKVVTIAGRASGSGWADGVGTNALFNGVSGISVDSVNNLLVTDPGNNQVRRVSAAGVVKSVAGSPSRTSAGDTDGVGRDARFHFPAGVAVDASGNVYVADTQNHTIRVVSTAGIVTTLAGLSVNEGWTDGAGSEARFGLPEGIAVDADGNVFVADGHAVRMISPSALVTTIAGRAEIPGNTDGPGDIARFSSPYDVAIAPGGTLMVSDSGNNSIRRLRKRGGGWEVDTVATLPDSPRGLAVDPDGTFFVLTQSRTLRGRPSGAGWTVEVAAETAGNGYHLVSDGAGRLYVPTVGSRTLMRIDLTGERPVMTTVGGAALFGEAENLDGAGTDARFGVPYGIAIDSLGNLYISDAVNHNIRKGTLSRYTPSRPTPIAPPRTDAQLTVTLLPAAAGGQWRFPWEPGWRQSGSVATNLSPGNYPLQFRCQASHVPIPSDSTAVVVEGVTTFVTNRCYPTLAGGDAGVPGTLTVNLGTGAPAGAGWRVVGESQELRPSGAVVPLQPGSYTIEFAAIEGRRKPANQAVRIESGLPSVIAVSYLLAGNPPADVLLPTEVPAAKINDISGFPFGFNGQLQTDNGQGSGVAVQQNVVLTAAHLVFNDQSLTYVSQAYWHPRRQAGVSEPQPLAARGYYLLGGYAAQRTNDLKSGLYAPDQSTPQSRNLDVAALYFLEPVAGGGHGGFLPSDEVPNPWLTGTGLKMLAGYPVDGSQFGDADIVPGRMYSTEPQPYPLTLATEAVPGQQVYIAPWFLSYPGNSGGPVYSLFNGYYHPAGIYLGTLFNGTQPHASAVRAIDSTVTNLITLAALQGASGTNNTGGGVITIVPSQNISSANKGYVQWQLGPEAAVRAGAAWRLQGDSAYSTSPSYVRQVTSTNAFAVEFRPIPGWNLPTNRTLTVIPSGSSGVISSNTALYSVVSPTLVIDPARGLGVIGTPDTHYRLESRDSLADGDWVTVGTHTVRAPGFNLLLPSPVIVPPARFYRLQWIP